MDIIEINKVQNGYLVRGSSMGVREGYYSSNTFIAKNLEEITEILKREPFLVGYEEKSEPKQYVETNW